MIGYNLIQPSVKCQNFFIKYISFTVITNHRNKHTVIPSHPYVKLNVKHTISSENNRPLKLQGCIEVLNSDSILGPKLTQDQPYEGWCLCTITYLATQFRQKYLHNHISGISLIMEVWMLPHAGHAKQLASQNLVGGIGQDWTRKWTLHGHRNQGKPNLGCHPNGILVHGQPPKLGQASTGNNSNCPICQ